MSSTPSEDKPDEIEISRTQEGGSDTAEENEDDMPIMQRSADVSDRKRRRYSSSARMSDRERERRLERYAEAKIRECEPTRKRSGSSKHNSRESSRARSERRSRSPRTPANPPRLGKRVRRRPQRWEGEGSEQTRSTRARRDRDADMGSGLTSDGEATVSAASVQDDPEYPYVGNPVLEMKAVVQKSADEVNRRAIVDSFHTWQLQSVSKQAAQQKSLQVYLKRKLRRRIAKMPDIERLEEEALTNARRMVVKVQSEDGTVQDTYTGFDDEADEIVPSRIRLPLDAYLPRRSKGTAKKPLAVGDVINCVKDKPILPPGFVENGHHSEDDGKWMCFETETQSSSLNKRNRHVEILQGKGR